MLVNWLIKCTDYQSPNVILALGFHRGCFLVEWFQFKSLMTIIRCLLWRRGLSDILKNYWNPSNVRNHYVNMSICHNATFRLKYQNQSCSECHRVVRPSLCQYVNMQLFSLGIKMKVVQNIIWMSDSHFVSM